MLTALDQHHSAGGRELADDVTADVLSESFLKDGYSEALVDEDAFSKGVNEHVLGQLFKSRSLENIVESSEFLQVSIAIPKVFLQMQLVFMVFPRIDKVE
jgi:hypothetical protein